MNSILNSILNSFTRTKYYLIAANILLVFFLILLSNTGVLPMRLGDFIFFSLIYLIFALYRPGWSFLFFVGTIALENINLAPEGLGIFVRPYQIIGGLTILSLLLRHFSKRLSFELVKLRWFDHLVGVFALSGILSSVFSPDKGTAFRQSIILFSFAALYWLVRNYIQTLDDLKRVTPFFLGSSAMVVFYGIWQNIRFIHGGNPFEVMPGRPNATFTEPDWLGIYLAIILAVVYSIIYYVSKSGENREPLISNLQFPISNEAPNSKLENSKFKIQNSSLHITPYYFYLAAIFILLILTVSRSAWLGAGFVTLVFLKANLTNFSFKFKEWYWKEFLKQLLFVVGAGIVSLGIVYIFHLTNFQLFNRAQSTASGLQKITVSCRITDCMKSDCISSKGLKPDSVINNIDELDQYGCRHIDLEDIDRERDLGFEIREIYRTDPNVNIRSQIYQKSIAEIKNHPVFGIGWGNISDILGKDERGTGLNSSNIFLEVWLGSGIIGLLAFLVIWVYILVKSVLYCIKDDAESKIIGLFVILGLFALLIPNLFNAGAYLGIIWIYLGVALSLTYKEN